MHSAYAAKTVVLIKKVQFFCPVGYILVPSLI